MSSSDVADMTNGESSGLFYTFSINLVVFISLITFFECNRHMKQIYQKRIKKKFESAGRVPPKPPRHPFGWILPTLRVSEDEFLYMVGLDGYMLLRFIRLCLKVSIFYSLLGVITLVPIYATSGGQFTYWKQYTISNVVNGDAPFRLWAPALSNYVCTLYICHLLYREYKHFVQRRLEYLIMGDPDTPPQSYYTVMLEHIPAAIRSAPMLQSFFEKLFPGEVFSVEVALDLNGLEQKRHARMEVRNRLEKSIAIWNATGERPTVYVSASDISNLAPDMRQAILATKTKEYCGRSCVDAIEYYTVALARRNDEVSAMQEEYLNKMQTYEQLETQRIRESVGSRASIVLEHMKRRASMGFTIAKKRLQGQKYTSNKLYSKIRRTENLTPEKYPLRKYSVDDEDDHEDVGDIPYDDEINFVEEAAAVAGTSMSGIAKEGLKTAQSAGKGALRGVLEATRTLELLTFGAYYNTSSTAFVTLSSRVAKSISHQMLLSHEHFTMEVRSAPNPKDIIWDNVSIPKAQVVARRTIAGATLVCGAVFWSAVVAFINASTNLDSISKVFNWLSVYQDTELYQVANDYLAVLLLVILLALLPLIFDMIARNYEGLKLESEIQNSIMARYFYYQLANVYITVTAGSVFSSLHQIINHPGKILNILGESLPQVSIYFANLIIVKTFASLPIEFLRVWPLINIFGVKCCTDKKKCTRRDLKTGAFADIPLDYGWIYPNLLMILMILVTYSCIAPLLMPFGIVYFAFAYLMYKYQLLYVYINDYQSGGYMWYAVFNRSMVSILCGALTLLGYLGLRKASYSGPFYVLLPLPFLIIYFWRFCNKKFYLPSKKLSMECAVEIDFRNQVLKRNNLPTPHDMFDATLYRQPALREKKLEPEPYRVKTRHSFYHAEERKEIKESEAIPTISEENGEIEDMEILEENINEVLGESFSATPRDEIPAVVSTSTYGSTDKHRVGVELSSMEKQQR